MPVTAQFRRQRRREATEEIEDPSTQEPVEDVDEDEEPSQPRRGKGVKREKTRPVDEEDEEEDPLANFGDQPVDRQLGSKINGIAEDWGHINSSLHKLSYGLVRDVASSIAEFTDGQKAEKNLAEIDRMMRSLIDTENELKNHEESLGELYQRVIRGEPVPAIVSRYEEDVERRINEYKQKTSRRKYAKHDDYASFRQAIYEVQHPDEAMPPITDLIPREDGDDSDDDEDIQVGGVTQDYKCPLTLTLLEDPLTSTVCGHSFSAAAIREYLKNNRAAREKCPTSGCNSIISLDQLKPDKALAKKAKEAARRERMREADSDSDDVIE